MTLKLLMVLCSAVFILSATTANAHDPALHKKENAEKPKCEAMQGMDHSKMDMNDPIMQAMMKQCIRDDKHKEGHEMMDKGQDNMHKSDTHKGDVRHGEMKKPR